MVGEFGFNFYEAAFSASLKKVGIDVIECQIKFPPFFSFIYKLESYFSIIGPITLLFYKRIKKAAIHGQPEIIFFWRPTQIKPYLLIPLKKCTLNSLIVNYNNDNPFGKEYQRGSAKLKRLWTNFKKSISTFDVNIVYRQSNINDYLSVGSKKTLLFPPAFIPEFIPELEHIEYKYDVVFIGYADKKRIEYINYLIEAGIFVKIYGTGWNIEDVNPLYKFNSIIPVHGNNYYRCLREGRINLAFLSELNEDVYTRRNFEIPGMGGLMLSERTTELVSFFEEGKEAFYFNTKDELLKTVNLLLANKDIQVQVRNAAKIKSFNSGYDLDSRVKTLISELNMIYEENKYSHIV